MPSTAAAPMSDSELAREIRRARQAKDIAHNDPRAHRRAELRLEALVIEENKRREKRKRSKAESVRARSNVVTHVRGNSTRKQYAVRAELIDRIRREEVQFTAHPTHLRAATLAGLRTLLTEVELKIVDLNMSEEG